MYTLHMLSNDHQGGGEGCVLTPLTSTSPTLRNMYTLRMLSYDHHGGWGWGGVLTSLTSTSLRCGTRCLKKINKCTKKIYTWAYAALLQSVASALPQAPWHWSVEKRKKMFRMVENHRFLVSFFDPWRAKSSHRAGETQIFTLESHACQSKWMSMLRTFFDDSCKYQHFVS